MEGPWPQLDLLATSLVFESPFNDLMRDWRPQCQWHIWSRCFVVSCLWHPQLVPGCHLFDRVTFIVATAVSNAPSPWRHVRLKECEATRVRDKTHRGVIKAYIYHLYGLISHRSRQVNMGCSSSVNTVQPLGPEEAKEDEVGSVCHNPPLSEGWNCGGEFKIILKVKTSLVLVDWTRHVGVNVL